MSAFFCKEVFVSVKLNVILAAPAGKSIYGFLVIHFDCIFYLFVRACLPERKREMEIE